MHFHTGYGTCNICGYNGHVSGYDVEYTFGRPAVYLAQRDLVRLFVLRSSIHDGSYRYDNELVLRDVQPSLIAELNAAPESVTGSKP